MKSAPVRSALALFMTLMLGLGPAIVSSDRSLATAAPTGSSSNGGKEPSAKMLSWAMGSTASAASIINSHGDSADGREQWKQANMMADALGVKLPALRARTNNQQTDLTNALIYILKDLGQVGVALAHSRGIGAGAAFDLGSKTLVLRFCYSPGSKIAASLAGAIRQDAPLAGVPASLWKPVTDLVARGASEDQVTAAIKRFYQGVNPYLQGPGAAPRTIANRSLTNRSHARSTASPSHARPSPGQQPPQQAQPQQQQQKPTEQTDWWAELQKQPAPKPDPKRLLEKGVLDVINAK